MKKFLGVMFIGILSVCMLAGCSKVKSDNSGIMALLGLGGGSAPAVQGVFVKEVIGGGGASSASSMWGTHDESRYMMMFPAGDIKGAGMITSISFKYNASPGADRTFNGVTIKMGHTSVTTLSSTYASNVQQGKGTYTTVLDNQSVTIPNCTVCDYFTIQLTQPFYYNGVDNLVVEVSRNPVLPTAGGVVLTTHTEDGVNYFTVYGTGSGASTATTGITAYTYPDVKFNFAGGDNRLHYGTTGNNPPFINDAAYQKLQLLYPAGTINGSGGIIGIGFATHTDSVERECTVTIRLGHTTRTELVTESWNANFNSGSPVTVATNRKFRVPAGIPDGAYMWLPLDGAFNYNGIDNLVVEIYVTSPNGNIFVKNGSAGANSWLVGSVNTPSDLSSALNNITFRFKGGTADVIGSGNHNLYPPFHGTVTGQFQPLYRAVELGLYGSINSIGFRLQNDSVAETYGNISIVIGHSDLDTLALGPSYLDNMNDEKTVFTGTVSVPAGLKAGDWVNIPLDTEFRYTSGKNLAIYVRHDAGASAIENFVQGESNTTRYPGRLLGTENQSLNNPGWVVDILPSIRLGLE